MARIAKEVAGQVISFIGLVGIAVSCGIPMWRVTSYIGANIVSAQIVWDGLWMRCVMQSTGQMQCDLVNDVLGLSADLQSARALVIFSLIFGFIGFMITFIGAKCTSCLKNESSGAKVVITGGCLIIVSAILILIPACWSATVTISDYESPLVAQTQKREIGASIYIGWGTAAVLLTGGIILTCSCPPQKPMYGAYPPAPMYPYVGPVRNPATYGPVYAAPSSGQYTATYIPGKPYAAPTTYSARRYP